MLEEHPALNRQTTKEAFCKFLMALRFPNNEDVCNLYGCTNCEKREEEDIKRMDAIVLDGTAMSILGKLPPFDRQTSTAHAAERVAIEQYIIRTPKKRAFVDGIFSSAKSSIAAEKISLSLKRKLKALVPSLFQRFFMPELESRCEEYLPPTYLGTCYELCSLSSSSGDKTGR